jgi:hypothetical protein
MPQDHQQRPRPPGARRLGRQLSDEALEVLNTVFRGLVAPFFLAQLEPIERDAVPGDEFALLCPCVDELHLLQVLADLVRRHVDFCEGRAVLVQFFEGGFGRGERVPDEYLPTAPPLRVEPLGAGPQMWELSLGEPLPQLERGRHLIGGRSRTALTESLSPGLRLRAAGGRIRPTLHPPAPMLAPEHPD